MIHTEGIDSILRAKIFPVHEDGPIRRKGSDKCTLVERATVAGVFDHWS